MYFFFNQKIGIPPYFEFSVLVKIEIYFKLYTFDRREESSQNAELTRTISGVRRSLHKGVNLQALFKLTYLRKCIVPSVLVTHRSRFPIRNKWVYLQKISVGNSVLCKKFLVPKLNSLLQEWFIQTG